MLESSNSVDSGTPGFYAFAAAHPDRPAIIDTDGTVVTFGVLLQRVNALSHAFLARGLRAGDAVAGVLHNGREFFEVLLAAGQLGLYYVPVNWHLKPDELAYIIRNSKAKLVIADAGQAAALPADELPKHRYSVHGELPGWEAFEELGSTDPTDTPAPRRAGTLMGYTSGTTGRPKGVKSTLPPMSPEEFATVMIDMAAYGVRPGAGIHLVCSPVYHAAPGGYAWAFLQSGHTLVIHPRFDAEATLRDIEALRVTSSHMVPTQFIRMLRLPEDVRSRYDLSSLEIVLHAGAPCPAPVKRRMIEWLGPIVWEYLASTEGGVTRVNSQEWLARPGTVGRPVPGTTVKILSDDGDELPPGEPGLIYAGIAGRPPAFEYLGDPEKTAAGRRGDLYTVGDFGYVDADGYVFLEDRRTDLIISGGVNIYPAEIEAHLIGHPAVEDVAVIGVPDAEWGRSAVAIVQPAAGVTADDKLADELLRHCEDGLAKFKRPRRIAFEPRLPRTPTGKLQRRVARDTYLKHQPRAADSATESWTTKGKRTT